MCHLLHQKKGGRAQQTGGAETLMYGCISMRDVSQSVKSVWEIVCVGVLVRLVFACNVCLHEIMSLIAIPSP